MQQRIAQISAQLAALSANANRPVPSTASGATGSAGPTSVGSTSAATGSSSFGSALADAVSARTNGSTGSGLAPSTGGTAPDAGTADAVFGSLTATTLTASTLTSNPLTANPLIANLLATGRPTAASTGAATSAYGATPAAPASSAGSAPRVAAPDLSSYRNGRIPTALLEPIGVGNHRLAAPAADKFRSMLAAAARDGVRIGVNDSYRSYDQQVDMARRKGLYSQGGLAAQPGTSDHGWGRSVDLQLDSRALRWMRSHADEYGFTANVPRESWHWTFRAGT